MATHAKLSAFSLLVLAYLSLVAISATDGKSNFMNNFSLPSASESGMIRLDDDSLSLMNDLRSKANVVVASDGTGNYATVKEAVAAVPENRKARYVIYIKKGIYKENIYIEAAKKNLTLVGDGRDSTILTGSLSNKTGHSIMESATLGVDAPGFMAQDMWFQNTAGPDGGQAVALRLNGDCSVIYQCRIDGYQDTLFTQGNRQFFRNCIITGTVDFIFGNSAAVFQYCEIQARKPNNGQSNMLTAQSRQKPSDTTGFSFHKCNITASADLARVKGTVKTFLGRPWRKFSRVVFLESFIEDHIDPKGWSPWTPGVSSPTVYYAEFRNRGPGADTTKRVGWKGFKVIKNPKEAANFTVANLISGHLWLGPTGVPFEEGL